MRRSVQSIFCLTAGVALLTAWAFTASPARAQETTTVDSVVVPANPTVAFADSLAAAHVSSSNSVFAHLQAVDLRLFYRVYLLEEPAFRGIMKASDATAFPVFFAAVPAAAAAALASGGGGDAAYRLLLSEGLALAAAMRIKDLAHRIRPNRHIDFLSYEGRGDRPVPKPAESFAFPSGHAAVAAALATSWSLSYPKWYVVAPSAAWVAGIGFSRIWYGRHYPGDVAAGILLGGATAALVHTVGPWITPGFLTDDDAREAPQFSVRIPIP